MTPEITGMTLNLQTWHMFIEKLLLPQIFLIISINVFILNIKLA